MSGKPHRLVHYLPYSKDTKKIFIRQIVYFFISIIMCPPALRSAQLDIPYTFLWVCYGRIR
nr:MAG TPA: hypothetical protein [Caudoviricetes sp.]